VRVNADPPRYRIPDLCVTFGEPDDDIFTAPPSLYIEILSPDDAAIEVREKIDEYLDFGVSYVWVINLSLAPARFTLQPQSRGSATGNSKRAISKSISPKCNNSTPTSFLSASASLGYQYR
jgi:hypothetical protein